jgi:hypothetical protein
MPCANWSLHFSGWARNELIGNKAAENPRVRCRFVVCVRVIEKEEIRPIWGPFPPGLKPAATLLVLCKG